MQGAKKMNLQEYDFYLRGGQVFDKSAQPANPCSDWIGETAWDHITELDKLPGFRNLPLVLRVERARVARVVPPPRARDARGAAAGRVGEPLHRAAAHHHRALPAARPHHLRHHRTSS